MSSLCRYDHAVMAVEALAKYIDTSAQDENTEKYLDDALSAIGELKKIEAKIPKAKGKKANGKQAMTSALAEFDAKLHGGLDKLPTVLNDIAKLHKSVTADIDKLQKAIARDVASLHKTTAPIDQAFQKFSALDNRMKKAKKSVPEEIEESQEAA
jgi:chromosome segregation ATPase